VAIKAKERGLPCTTQQELGEALFADGLSTRDVATDTSGRGIGMAAVREACRALGGEVEVVSEAGAGTTVCCRFPESAMGGTWVAAVKRMAVTDSLAPGVA
jgi:two-component system chemotaxis sensor kinase CheA